MNIFALSRSSQFLQRRFFSSDSKDVKITFINPDGSEDIVTASVGDSLLDVALDNDLDVEGACGGEIACSTCHMILTENIYQALSSPCEEEEDMLDMALGVTETSRLGCQVKVTKEMDGMTITLPQDTANMQ